ncbi:MAG: DNA primase [Desulfurococcales archaeon ex4484_42]|nr:MAG: DNA primase [Desulfurococcales archaeon ex4484_42]
MKYLIRARIEVEGSVEKSDIIGAIFGQTEGLFGPDFDLRDLQDKGRIGRIIVDIKRHGNRTVGEVLVPSNLDKAETALVAAMLEFVDKVGPFNAKIKIVDIIDVRYERIRKIKERAKEILQRWLKERTIDVKEIINEIEEAVRIANMIYYGPERLPAGPDVDKSDTLIIVEGRADVLNLLRYGYRNVIAIEGAKGEIPETIIKLSKSKKNVIAFVDGDRAGDMILKELIRVAKIDYIAKAPQGREVEELTSKEIAKALKSAVPVKTYLQQLEAAKAEAKAAPTPEVEAAEVGAIQIPQHVVENIKELRGTLEAILYNNEWKPVDKVPVKDIVEYLIRSEGKNIYAIVMDGIITQRVVDAASVRGVKLIIGARTGVISKMPSELTLLTYDDVLH